MGSEPGPGALVPLLPPPALEDPSVEVVNLTLTTGRDALEVGAR